MARNGDAAKGIWMTEIGWTAADDISCTVGANAGKRSDGVTAGNQASFLKQAFACIAADPYVRMASWYTLQDHAAGSRYGLYDLVGSARPVPGRAEGGQRRHGRGRRLRLRREGRLRRADGHHVRPGLYFTRFRPRAPRPTPPPASARSSCGPTARAS